jgi:hypothetical protein
MMVTAGLMDKRVGYWEAAKWVAELRAKQSRSSDSAAAGQLRVRALSPAAGRERLLLLRTDMSGGHFSAGGSVSSIDEAAVKYAFLMATLPSCGSPEGLTGLDAPDGTLTAGSSRWAAAAADKILLWMQYLPPPVQHIMVMMFTVMVMFGLVGVVWQASKVWWPPAINPADLYDLAESEDIDISQLLPAVQARSANSKAAGLPSSISRQQCFGLTREQAVGGSSSSSSSKVVRDIARRTSTAAGDRLHHQCGEATASPSMTSVNVSDAARLDRQYCAGSSGWHDGQVLGSSNSGSGSGFSGTGPGSESHAGNVAVWAVVEQQQQQQQMLGVLADDWLLDLTSGVPRSCRPISTSQHVQQQHHSHTLSPVAHHSFLGGADGADDGRWLLTSNGSLGSTRCSSSSSNAGRAVSYSSAANGSRTTMPAARRCSNGGGLQL